jgi:integrase
MSRYRSTRLVARSGHDAGIAEAVNDFLLYHRRKGHSENYDRELRSYLIGFRASQTMGKSAPFSNASSTSSSTSNYWKANRSESNAPKRLKAQIKVFTPEEIERMRQVVTKENARDQAIFMLLLDSGIRASELCNLRLDDVRWERQQLIIRPEIAKNASHRLIPLYGSMKALRKYRSMRGDDTSQCDKLFLSFFFSPVVAKQGVRRNIGKIVFCNSGLTRNGLYFLIAKWGRLAGISESRCSEYG